MYTKKKKSEDSRIMLVTLIFVALLVTIVTLGLGGKSEAAENSKEVTSSPAAVKAATEFVQKAAVANMYEVQASQIALSKTDKPKLHEFAEHMVTDHSKAGDDLKKVIDSSSVDKANVPSDLDAKHKAMLEKLKDLEGTALEKQYTSDMKKGHADAVALFSDYAKNGQDRALKNFAAKTLPTLKEHKAMAANL